jgi:hypothetical protein
VDVLLSRAWGDGVDAPPEVVLSTSVAAAASMEPP